MVKFRAKHVCTPGARRVTTPPWKRQVNKVKVVAVEQLPADYVPETAPKKRKKAVVKNFRNLANCDISEAVAKSTRMSNKSDIPRITITCGGYQQTKKSSERAYEKAIAMIRDAGIPISKAN